MNPLKKGCYIARYLGPRVVGLRARVYLANALGSTRRAFRPRPWEDIDLASVMSRQVPTDPADYALFKRGDPPEFLFSLGEPPVVPQEMQDSDSERTPPLDARLDLLAENRCVYFMYTPSPEAIDWHHSPFDDTRGASDKMWCEIPDFDPAQGDLRVLWEPSRAAWSIDLARGRARRLDTATGELFWTWWDSWMAANQPFQGVNWKCGQESSVRMIAAGLGFWAMANDPATTAERWMQFARLAWATGYRVARHIGYAVSQKNNHALSEACGLLLISHLFPEFRAARRWGATGRKVLASELRRQVYEDGSYVQHSMNYHRVMLHVSLLGLRLGELAGDPFDRDLYDRIGRAGEFLHQVMDVDTGRVPNYGHNDGADVLPLSECDFTDYRPVVQAAHFLATGRRLLPTGPWDEDLLWLFGPAALEADRDEHPQPVSTGFEVGGYYTLRRDDSWAMIRCHTYRDRPSHVDPLHLDLWWRGLNILRDCGTYQYYIPGRGDIERYFKSIAGHNTVEIDGRDPIELVSRFLWLPWPKARVRHYEPRNVAAKWFEGEARDYERCGLGVRHRRALVGLAGNVWVIIDDLFARKWHRATVRWHLLDAPWEEQPDEHSIVLSTSEGKLALAFEGDPASAERLAVVRGCDAPGEVQGFGSLYYGRRDPIPTVEATFAISWPQRVVTVVAPGETASASCTERTDQTQRWEIKADGDAWIMDLAKPDRVAERIILDHHAAADEATDSEAGS